MFFSSIKEINRLISKGMSNVYSKVTIEKNWLYQNFNFLSLRVYLQVSFWGAAAHAGITEFSSFLLQLKNQRSGSKTVWLFHYFDFERNYDPYLLLNENINFNKNKRESKKENPTHSFRETNLMLQLI